jgi:hypothetical protein
MASGSSFPQSCARARRGLLRTMDDCAQHPKSGRRVGQTRLARRMNYRSGYCRRAHWGTGKEMRKVTHLAPDERVELRVEQAPVLRPKRKAASEGV